MSRFSVARQGKRIKKAVPRRRRLRLMDNQVVRQAREKDWYQPASTRPSFQSGTRGPG